MKHTRISKTLLVLFAVVLCFGPVGLAEPLGTAFTYQGRLIDANNAADGLYDFQFKLFNAVSDGNKLGQDVNNPEVDVIDGYFTVELDFGNVFDGNNRWLEIGVRPGIQNDPNVYAALSPRQKITPAPYALYVLNGGGGADSDWITTGNNMYSGVSGNVGIGTISPVAKLDVTGYINVASAYNYKIGNSTVLSVPGTGNTFVGVGIGTAITSGSQDTLSGYQAGYAITSGSYNTFSGYQAGYADTTGSGNTFLGFQTGYLNTTGNSNTFLGQLAGRNNTASYNTFLGNTAGYSNTTGNNNTFTGDMAGYSNTTGIKNTFLGNSAGLSNGTGSGNVFIGYNAGYSETGSNKLYIANSSANPPLIYGDFSAGNVGIGTISPSTKLDVSGVITATGGNSTNWNTAYSWGNHASAGYLTAETDPQVASTYLNCLPKWNGFALVDTMIYESGLNVGIGITTPSQKLDVSGSINTTADYKIDGNTVLAVNDRADVSIGIGAGANETDITCGSNIYLGYMAGYSHNGPGGASNIFVGTRAGFNNSNGYSDTIVGNYAGYIGSGGANTFIGERAGYHGYGGYNTYLGFEAGRGNPSSNPEASANTFIGGSAGQNIGLGCGNTFSGCEAGFTNYSGRDNVFSGYQAGYDNNDGSYNTYLGNFAGFENQSGSGNVCIGFKAGYNAAGSNKLYIANSNADANVLICGDFSSRNVGIGTTSPARALHVSDVIRLQPRATAPSSPAEGDIYMDSTTHTLMVYNGTIWKPCF